MRKSRIVNVRGWQTRARKRQKAPFPGGRGRFGSRGALGAEDALLARDEHGTEAEPRHEHRVQNDVRHRADARDEHAEHRMTGHAHEVAEELCEPLKQAPERDTMR